MVTQYPHYLFAVTTAEATQDERGYWSTPSQQITLLSMCREETNGAGQEVVTADGRYHKFSSLIQIPYGNLAVSEGTEVIVANDREGASIRIQGTTLKFDKGQLHSRLWL